MAVGGEPALPGGLIGWVGRLVGWVGRSVGSVGPVDQQECGQMMIGVSCCTQLRSTDATFNNLQPQPT